MTLMRQFFESYEHLRSCEKRLIGEGFSEKHFTKKKNIYGKLIKLFAQRSEAVVEFSSRKSLIEKPKPLSEIPNLFVKRIPKRDQTAQTEKIAQADKKVQTEKRAALAVKETFSN